MFRYCPLEEFVLENGKASEFLSQCEVGFEDIKMVLQQKGKKPDRVILDGSFKGNARPGRMVRSMTASLSTNALYHPRIVFTDNFYN